MKRVLSIVIAMGLLLLAACGTPNATESLPATEDAAASEAVIFTDPVLEAKVREAMGKPDGEITIAEANAVERFDFRVEDPGDDSAPRIKDISALRYFKNLKSLDLSYHQIEDLSPLAGMKQLEALYYFDARSVKDFSALAELSGMLDLIICSDSFSNADMQYLKGMTNIELLWIQGGKELTDIGVVANFNKLYKMNIENSGVSDISPVAGITSLVELSLRGSKVSDVSPLKDLVNLRTLYLEGCPVTDFSPLADIYPNLTEKDFALALSLKELGFTLIDNNTVAGYKTEEMIITVNHSDWGVPQQERDANSVRMYLQLESGYTLIVGYYPDDKTYGCSVTRNEERLTDYTYDTKDGTLGLGGRESAEELMRTVLGDFNSQDILLAPIDVFNDTIHSTFGIGAEVLYALPFERISLLSLGFKANPEEAVCVYEQHEGNYTGMAIHRPEWGELEYSVHFFTSVNEYGVMVRYEIDQQRYYVRAEASDGAYADFEFFWETHAKNGFSSPEGMTVEQFFQQVYDDPEIADVFLYSVLMVQRYFSDTFGMSIDELYALPSGE